MDIAALSIIKNQMQIQQAAKVAVMKKAMDTAEQNGSFINQMVDKIQTVKNPDLSNLPHIGNNLDVYV